MHLSRRYLLLRELLLSRIGLLSLIYLLWWRISLLLYLWLNISLLWSWLCVGLLSAITILVLGLGGYGGLCAVATSFAVLVEGKSSYNERDGEKKTAIRLIKSLRCADC